MASTRIAVLTGSPQNGAGSSSGSAAAPVTAHERPTASEDRADTGFLPRVSPETINTKYSY